MSVQIEVLLEGDQEDRNIVLSCYGEVSNERKTPSHTIPSHAEWIAGHELAY